LFTQNLKLTQLAGCISAASIPKLVEGQFFLMAEIEHIRNGYLFFSIVGLLKAFTLYSIFSIDLIDYVPSLSRLPWRILD
jgi:hypothetical protein